MPDPREGPQGLEVGTRQSPGGGSPHLALRIEELDLSERSRHGLEGARITTIGELVEKTPGDLLGIADFTQQSLDEVIERLGERGLSLRTVAARQRWRLLVAYNGSGFRGFAPQEGQVTVAGALAGALARAARLPAPPVIVCAGRTDAGVHARGQVVHVDLPDLPQSVDLVRSLNRQLAPSVVVRRAEPAPAGFDARRSATARHYRYLVLNSPVSDPLLAPIAWHVADPLDLRAMAAATDALIGEHDFAAFCRRPPGASDGDPIVRVVTSAGWSERPCTLLRLDISAGSFCHQMVRSLVGTLVAVGRGRGNAATVVARLRSGTRQGAPQPAPPHGLCLVKVSYGDTPGLP